MVVQIISEFNEPHGNEVAEFEEAVAQTLTDLKQSTDARPQVKDLKMCGVNLVAVGGESAIIIWVPHPQLEAFRKNRARISREMVRKFSGKHVVLIAERTVLLKPSKKTSSSQRISSSKSSDRESSLPIESYDRMSRLKLQETYRNLESRLKSYRRRRECAESTLNDITRASQGVNTELDPTITLEGGEQQRSIGYESDIESEMQRIANELSSRFDYEMSPDIHPTTHQEARQRAEVSTATSLAPQVDWLDRLSKENRLQRIKFKLNDSNTWCSECDVHFDTLSEYCEHLHTSDHLRLVRGRSDPPWRVQEQKDELDTRQTYELLQSICYEIGHEIDTFHFNDLDYALNSTLENFIKNIGVKREKGEFDEDDPLLKIKGYDQLIPLSGFYCKLCSCTLRDLTEAELHLRSYDHNYAHTKSVALDSQHEITFRTKLDKSRKKQFGDEESSEGREVNICDRESANDRDGPEGDETAENSEGVGDVTITNNILPSTSSASPSETAAAPLLRYKKATSKIVDEHEAIAGLFPQKAQPERKVPSPAEARKLRRAILESDSENENSENDDSENEGSENEDLEDEDLEDEDLEDEDSEDEDSEDEDSEDDDSEDEDSKDEDSDNENPALENGPTTPKNESLDLSRRRITRSLSKTHRLPIGEEDESTPAAPKRLRTESWSDHVTRRNVSSSHSKTSDSLGPDIRAGDPDSPFPELDLSVSRNLSAHFLRDERLKKDCKVKLTKLKFDDYKDLLFLLPSCTRIKQLIKEERKSSLSSMEARTETNNESIFFDAREEAASTEMDENGDSCSTSICGHDVNGNLEMGSQSTTVIDGNERSLAGEKQDEHKSDEDSIESGREENEKSKETNIEPGSCNSDKEVFTSTADPEQDTGEFDMAMEMFPW